jgi:acylphosphatase
VIQGTRFSVTGSVQGVGFRWWVRSRALDLGLTGSVRNCDDGSVEVVAVGSTTALDSLRSALHRGPPGSTVDAVIENEVEMESDADSAFFIIR